MTAGWTVQDRKTYFQWFTQNHSDDAFVGEYREWAERVNQRPSLSGNGGPLNQVRAAAIATLTDQEKGDAELAQMIAQPIPGAIGGRGGGGGAGAPGGAPPAGGPGGGGRGGAF